MKHLLQSSFEESQREKFLKYFLRNSTSEEMRIIISCIPFDDMDCPSKTPNWARILSLSSFRFLSFASLFLTLALEADLLASENACTQ